MAMEELIKAMSDEDLANLKEKYPDNVSIATLIDGILQTRQAEAVQGKAMADFEKGLAKTFAKLPHPDNIYNVYVRWAEVDVPDGEAQEVELMDPEGNKTTETRIPTHREYQWVIEVNHATKVTSGSSTNGTPKTSKRAITVFKREGVTLIPKGNYPSASKACEGLGCTIGGDSAVRVLQREGYIIEPYDGTDFAS